ncbi:hypothetical protein B0H14DRAFT_2578099 [Mycena olivaceomarginata]|nr:hypothetical protein B0H14DRAFT_2578099 [Mycena olivaceomarginata]
MSTACWTRVLIPHTNSGMQLYGICRDFTSAGVFRVKLLSVALTVPSAVDVPSGPMFYSHPFQHYPQQTSTIKYLSPTSIDSHVLNSSADPSSSSAPRRSNDEKSAFNKSASDPYNYPITQIPPTSQSTSNRQDCQQAVFERTFQGNGIRITILLSRINIWPNDVGRSQWWWAIPDAINLFPRSEMPSRRTPIDPNSLHVFQVFPPGKFWVARGKDVLIHILHGMSWGIFEIC